MPGEANPTAVLYGIDDIRLEDRPLAEPKDGEVLLRMACVGICGSDVHYWKRGRIGKFILTGPMVIGHEASGTVAKLGPGVKSLAVGDRVAIEPGVSCSKCRHCMEGRYNLCPEMKFCATPPYDGNLAKYYVHPAHLCFKLPDDVSLEEGALMEPLSVGVHACRRGGVGMGSTVLVLGAGPIGLVTAITASAMSASTVLVTDVLEHRLEVAKKCGATSTLLIGKNESDESVVNRIRTLLNDKMPDVTIDCVGFNSTTNIAIQATRDGGKFVLVGMGSDEVKVPLVLASSREVDVIGSFRYCNDYPAALEMIAQKKANVRQLITHNFKLDETVKAFETAHSGEGNPIKIIIHC